MPARIGQITGKSVNEGKMARGKSDTWAKLADTTAAAATTEPDDKSIPLVMITRFTPTAMMPITDICKMMICKRSILKIKLWPFTYQPSASKNRLIPTSTIKMLASGGSLNLGLLLMAEGAETVEVVMVASFGELLGSQVHDGNLICIFAVQNAGDSTFVHDNDAVAHAEHFGHF